MPGDIPTDCVDRLRSLEIIHDGSDLSHMSQVWHYVTDACGATIFSVMRLAPRFDDTGSPLPRLWRAVCSRVRGPEDEYQTVTGDGVGHVEAVVALAVVLHEKNWEGRR